VSELPTGAYAPEYSSDGDESKAKQVAGQTKQAAGEAVAEVKDTAAEQAQRVGHEAKAQARNVAGDVRDKIGEQARTQNDRLVGSIRQTADQLDEMRGDRADSPAATVVSRVADGGRQLADYLDRNGPEGVLQEVQDFARRRPGAFLATALAAGFVVGRLGKSVAKADPTAGTGAGKPRTDTFASNYPATSSPAAPAPAPAYAAPAADYVAPLTEYTTPAGGYVEPATEFPVTGAGTEYASTGTGTPVVVEDEYGYQNPEPRR
jgi:hypothetical protein